MGNKGSFIGGGMYITGTDVTLDSSVQISGNSAVCGGGIYTDDSKPSSAIIRRFPKQRIPAIVPTMATVLELQTTKEALLFNPVKFPIIRRIIWAAVFSTLETPWLKAAK